MKNPANTLSGCIYIAIGLCIPNAQADENFFGYVSGAETLPKGANEAYLRLTYRDDKGVGHYDAYDVEAEYERGITSRLTGTIGLQGQ